MVSEPQNKQGTVPHGVNWSSCVYVMWAFWPNTWWSTCQRVKLTAYTSFDFGDVVDGCKVTPINWWQFNQIEILMRQLCAQDVWTVNVCASFGVWEDDCVCVVIQLPGNCGRSISWNMRNNNKHKKCWQIHKKCKTVNNNTVGWFQSDVAIPFNSNPCFPKWPMSNWLHPLTAMIKVRSISTCMWICQVKRQLPNSV